MDNLDKMIAIEKFVDKAKKELDDVTLLTSFLRIEDDKVKAAIMEALQIYKNKLNKIKKADSMDTVSKHIKVKKVLKRYGESE